MDEIREMFLKLQSDVNSTKDSLKEMEANITTNINSNISEIFGNLQIKIQKLEEKNIVQEQRLDALERTQRQRNVVIFGVAEEERSYNELAYKILSILNDTMNVQCTLLEVQALRRIGRKGDKIRPVVLTLSTLGRKIEIQKKWKTLQNTTYSITEDYPPKVLEIRKSLYEKAKKEKENGNRAVIKYDKLIILPPTPRESVTQESRNTKRALSQTPPQTDLNAGTKERAAGAMQAQKKNKISSYWNTARNPTRATTETHGTGKRQQQQQIQQ